MKIAYLLAAFGRESVLSRKAILVFLGGRALLQNLNPQFLVSRCAASFRCVALSVVLSVFSNSVAAETIPATLHWGWMRGWGAPWGSQICGQDYSFEAADEFGCAPIAEACHPNVGQQNYSPFVGIAGCVILTSSGRLAGGGGAWYACPPDQNWTLSGANCIRPDQCQPPDVIDTATGQCMHCSIVLASTEITDPVAKLYEDGTYNSTDKPDLGHLNQATRTGLACIQQKVAALRCYMTPRPASGYRPTAYQKHLRDVYDNWMKIKDDTSPACADAKQKAKKEFDYHSYFAHRPGATSNHSQLDAAGNPAGNAVDISGVPDNALDSADVIAAQCTMKRPLMNMPNPADNDPIHYQPE